jgi:hypothetical protein
MKSTKRQLQKKATTLRHKEKRKIERQIKKTNKQAYQDFVKFIKERDNWTCQISGKYLKDSKPQSLQVVHILSKENYPQLMLDPMNVICLSFYFHKNSPLSPHLDGFAFVSWFQNKFPDRYVYLLNKLREK